MEVVEIKINSFKLKMEKIKYIPRYMFFIFIFLEVLTVIFSLVTLNVSLLLLNMLYTAEAVLLLFLIVGSISVVFILCFKTRNLSLNTSNKGFDVLKYENKEIIIKTGNVLYYSYRHIKGDGAVAMFFLETAKSNSRKVIKFNILDSKEQYEKILNMFLEKNYEKVEENTLLKSTKYKLIKL